MIKKKQNKCVIRENKAIRYTGKDRNFGFVNPRAEDGAT